MSARVERLTEADWQAYAWLRLRALSDTFSADDPPYRTEAAFTAAQWRRRIRSDAAFAAFYDGRPVGLIAAHRENTDRAYLYSLWLDPQARGHGTGHDLVAAALRWARSERMATVTLRVAAGNDVARGLYEAFGFSEVAARRGDPPTEVAMALQVR